MGCTYKYLNGGPGSPAFVWVRPATDHSEQPLAGWWSHAAPFEFTPDYRPAPGIAHYLCGTQPILAWPWSNAGIDTVLAAEPDGRHGGAARKIAGTDRPVHRAGRAALRRARPALVTPREHARRGSPGQPSHPPQGAYAIVQALIARGVIGDFRAGIRRSRRPSAQDILRFGFTPLYTGFEDVWNAVSIYTEQVLGPGRMEAPRIQPKTRRDQTNDQEPSPPTRSIAERESPARFQPVNELRRLPAARRHPECAKAALARSQRDAVHHPAPDQRAVDEADAARAACGHRCIAGDELGSAFKMLARVSAASWSSWCMPGTCWPP